MEQVVEKELGEIRVGIVGIVTERFSYLHSWGLNGED